MEKEESAAMSSTHKNMSYMGGNFAPMAQSGYSMSPGFSMMSPQYTQYDTGMQDQTYMDMTGQMAVAPGFMAAQNYEMSPEAQIQQAYANMPASYYMQNNPGAYAGGFQAPGMIYAGSHGMINPTYSAANAMPNSPAKTEKRKKWCGMC